MLGHQDVYHKGSHVSSVPKPYTIHGIQASQSHIKNNKSCNSLEIMIILHHIWVWVRMCEKCEFVKCEHLKCAIHVVVILL